MLTKRKVKKSINFIMLMTALLVFMPSNSIAGVNGAYQHIYEVMGKYHQTFDVYTDLSAAGNHFVTYGGMASSGDEDRVMLNLCSTTFPHSGDTCIENNFIANGNNWGGWYFMNGVLEGAETQPKLNWGNYPNAGVDLSGTKQLTFWARGAKGGERVEFFAFGIGRNATTGKPVERYPDSSPKISLGYKTLSTNWTQYSINLTGRDLSYVLGGFGWVTNAPQNNYQDIVFYLDDIRYNKSRLNEPRFLVSYETIPSSNDFDTVLKNVAFTYDNALALIALLARGKANDVTRAGFIADAFVYAIDNDRFFTDGRLRDAYQGGDLILPPGWTPNGRENTVRMTGWWDPNYITWQENKGFVGTSTGNLAWAMIALLSYYEQVNDSNYLDAAKVLGEWIEANTRDTNGVGGYVGGYEGWEATSNNPQGQTKLTWKSTEHNIDVYVAFMRLHELTEEPNWLNGALHAQTFVEAMWDANEGHFWTGTLNDGITINKTNIPLDIQAWAVMAMDGYNSALSWAESNCYTEANDFNGFDFNNDRDGIWFEGTAQMAVAYLINEEPNKADVYLSELRKAQESAANNNGKGIVAASHDGVTTGFGWEYFSRLHIGATSWYIFAEMEYNPYWGTLQTGSLQVTIRPQGAINVGAQWRRVETTTWYNSGDVESGIPVGSYTVEFKSITGCDTPTSQSVTINNGQTTNASGTYTRHLLVTKCTVTAGSKDNSDAISFSGLMDANEADFHDANEIQVSVNSNDMVNPLIQTFPINDKAFKNGKYNYARTENASKRLFKYDTKNGKFTFMIKNVDLSGLGCPLTIEIEIGDYTDAAEVNEAIVNGSKKPIPIKLMMGVKDSLRVDKCKVRSGKNPFSDSLSVKGAITLKNTSCNLTGEAVTLTFGSQTITIPANSFTKKGDANKCLCKNVNIYQSGTVIAVVNATFDFDKCSFIITVKKAMIESISGTVNCEINFCEFDEMVEVDVNK
jgi:hypothetical protein